MAITLFRTDASHPDFIALVKLLDQNLKITDGDDHDFYNQFNQLDKIRQAVIAYDGNKALGCGAFKKYTSDTVEIKRMFVRDSARNKGIATLVLQELERWAGELHYRQCILETGTRQHAAIRLYQKNNYQVIPNYGPYEGLAGSVCMQKDINT